MHVSTFAVLRLGAGRRISTQLEGSTQSGSHWNQKQGSPRVRLSAAQGLRTECVSSYQFNV